MSGAHTYITYFPTDQDRPYGKLGETHVALHFTAPHSFQNVNLQFSSPSDEALAVRYLRDLAEAATALADQVEQRTREAAAATLPIDCFGDGHEIEAEVQDCRTCTLHGVTR